MTQLSNVPMQPNPSAVERPLTLVEKLERVIIEHNAEFNKIIKDATDHQKVAHTAVLAGLLSAIKVVKQHSEWIPVSEEIPVLEYECGFRSFEPTNFYQIIDNEGCLHNAYFSTNHYANDDRALFTLCELSLYNGKWLVDDEYEVITVNMVKFWKPLQLPNWAQEKIYEQEIEA